MELQNQSSTQVSPNNPVPGQNVTQLRDDRPVNEFSQAVGAGGNDPSIKRRDPLSEHLEAERQERAKVETGRNVAFQLTGHKARDDQHAKLLRTTIRKLGMCNLSSFIGTLVPKLTPTDISENVKIYITFNDLDPVPFNKRPTWSAGGK